MPPLRRLWRNALAVLMDWLRFLFVALIWAIVCYACDLVWPYGYWLGIAMGALVMRLMLEVER